MHALGTVQSLTRKAEMGADSWRTRLVRVRDKNTVSGAKGLFPEMFENDFQRTKSQKVERFICMVRKHSWNIGAWDWHMICCGVRPWWWERG